MKLFDHYGLDVRILLRDHCPPHAHVVGPDWRARFIFSFANNGVSLWDIDVVRKQPKAKDLEAVRQRLMERRHLVVARRIWSMAMVDLRLCLVNQAWDDESEDVVPPAGRNDVVKILHATYDAGRNITKLDLEDEPFEVEIEL